VIGIVMWRHAPDAMPTASGADAHVRGVFTKGLLLGLSNPKVVVFFGTIFTTAFAPSTPGGGEMGGAPRGAGQRVDLVSARSRCGFAAPWCSAGIDA